MVVGYTVYLYRVVLEIVFFTVFQQQIILNFFYERLIEMDRN